MAVGSFSAGLSGLNANAVYLSVIGNNLANINTIGFKSSSVSFMDLVSQTVGGSSGNPMQVGLGVVTGSISPIFSQGTIENTREATNVAIQGGGLFVVNGAEGNTYTRAGHFSFDSKGTLVTPDGYKVQGYTTIDPSTGVILATGPAHRHHDPARCAAAAECDDDLRHDLEPGRRGRGRDDGDHRRADLRCARGAARRDDHLHEGRRCRSLDLRHHGSGRRNHGRHRRHAILHRFRRAAVRHGRQALVIHCGGTGDGWRHASGRHHVHDADLEERRAASSLTWDIVDANNKASITGFSAPSATSSKTQNGSAPGMVDNISISADGTIIATFGAGQTVGIGRLALATFNNLKGLVKLGSNRYGETQAAGLPNVGVAGTGGRGTLIGSALEQSNVDIAQEFTQMILAQRGYQANSKTITVSDEILVDTLNLKR